MEGFIFSNKARAEALLDNLNDIINKYGVATVADAKTLYGIPTRDGDENRGWINLDNASFGSGELEGEVVLCLPKPFPIV